VETNIGVTKCFLGAWFFAMEIVQTEIRKGIIFTFSCGSIKVHEQELNIVSQKGIYLLGDEIMEERKSCAIKENKTGNVRITCSGLGGSRLRSHCFDLT
jgi:hypothetical protein